MSNPKGYGVVDAGAAMAPAGAGPYNPVNEENIGTKYFKRVQKDLSKRYGAKGNKKNPPYTKGNKIVN